MTHFSSADIGFNVDSLVDACSRPVSTVAAKVACPFCNEYTQTSEDQAVEKSVLPVVDVKRHLASHMEDLALLSITTSAQDAAETAPQVSHSTVHWETFADILRQTKSSTGTFVSEQLRGASDETEETIISDVLARSSASRIKGNKSLAPIKFLRHNHIVDRERRLHASEDYQPSKAFGRKAKARLVSAETRVSKQSKEAQHTVGSLSDFAMECADQGRWEAAENIQAKVVQACRDALGRDHPDTLKSKARLAVIYSCQGRLWKAEELQREESERVDRQK